MVAGKHLPTSDLYGRAFTVLQAWYESYRSPHGIPPKVFVINAGLMILENYRDKIKLERSDIVTDNNRARTNRSFIQGILSRYGEDRLLSKEGGRTTSSTVTAAEALYPQLNVVFARSNPADQQHTTAVHALQRWIAERGTEYLNQSRIEVEIVPAKPTALVVRGILNAASGKSGAVAQHLVGAKLQMRLPNVPVENHGYTTADDVLNRQGDFLVHDAVFHVTMSPMPPVIQKCKRNLIANYKPYLLVPDQHVSTASGLAKIAEIETEVSIIAIETFVAQNLDEMGSFERQRTGSMFRQLLEIYNERVAAVETDPSLLIEIPENLM